MSSVMGHPRLKSLFSTLLKKVATIYPHAKRRLHRFNGGIFPKYYKEISANQPIRERYIPQRLVLPLQQQVGSKAEVLVSVGDYVQKNQLIARSSKDADTNLIVPIHAPTSGEILAIEPRTLPHASGLQDLAIILHPDHKHTTIENALEVSGAHPSSATALKQIILDAGIVGMGGAGFPTYAKLPREKGKIHTLLINGAECEPFISCDDLLMQTEADSIIQGALITAEALGADKIICGIESNKPSAIKAMKMASQHTIVDIKEVQTVYPMGGQKQLTQELTGLEIPNKGHAVDLGMLMMNVATYAAIYRAVKFGEPLTSRMVSVTGLGLEAPFNIAALIGTPFIELVNLAKPKSKLVYPLVMGGPMMGFAVHDNQVPVIKTTNCILATPPQPIEMQMPCIRCGACMDACPINLLPQQMFWHSQAREFEKVEKLNLFDCIECGCCSYVCPSNIPLVQYYRNAKSEIKEIKAEEKAVELAKQRHEFKLARIEREKAEREAKLKAKKAAVKKQAAQKVKTDNQTDQAKPKSAAAAARATAAKKVAAGKAEHKPIPPARRKAIEAAQKAANNESLPTTKAKSKGAVKTGNLKSTPSDVARDAARDAAKAAAMAAAKKRAQAKASPETNDKPIEPKTTAKHADKEAGKTTGQTTGRTAARDAAKAAAMAAAKKRAQAKASPETNDKPIESKATAKHADKEAGKATGQTSDKAAARNAARDAAKAAAMAAAKKRKQNKLEPKDPN